jgi:hypothetical protein
MGWFPVFANFIEGQEFKRLTCSEKLYFWYLASNFNLRGEFYQSDLEIAVTLGTSEKTIRRGRAKLTKMGLIKVKPGQLKKNRPFATLYMAVRYAKMGKGGHFAQVYRFTFLAMLHRLRKFKLQIEDVVVYVCLTYWFWRNRGKYEDRNRFYITKKELKSLTGLHDAPRRSPHRCRVLRLDG